MTLAGGNQQRSDKGAAAPKEEFEVSTLVIERQPPTAQIDLVGNDVDDRLRFDAGQLDIATDGLIVDLTESVSTGEELETLTTWQLPATSRYRGWRLVVKRAIDIVGSLALLLVFAPILAVVALAVALESPGGAFFKQMRVGRNGNLFPMFKLRSMYIDAEQRLASDEELLAMYRANDYKFPDSADPRVTRLGNFLRKSSIDELPQLFSVLRGHMSLVGPRPVVPDELVRARRDDAYVHATPGITGTWQVEARSTVGYPERCEFDNRYVAEWSVASDIGLLLRTIPAVILRRGAH